MKHDVTLGQFKGEYRYLPVDSNTWIGRIPGKFEVLWKLHIDLSMLIDLPAKLEIGSTGKNFTQFFLFRI